MTAALAIAVTAAVIGFVLIAVTVFVAFARSYGQCFGDTETP